MSQIKTAILLLLFFILLTGIIYPAVVTVSAQIFFPWQANGSLISVQNHTIGSVLIGQSFTSDKYFWGRPSATKPFPYNAANSAGSNFGPLNSEFLAAVKTRVSNLQKTASITEPVPVDLVTASGSGLDPDISPPAAFYQIKRIAKSRHIPETELEDLVKKSINPRVLGILGEPSVNVLELNLKLDELF